MTNPSSARALDAMTIDALVREVDAAKARGWLQPDLKRWFSANKLDLSTYRAAVAGEAVSLEARGALTAISFNGLPQRPHVPNAEDIRRHILWLTEPAAGDYDDALFEIAWDGEGRGPSNARLFGLDEIDEAVAFAAQRNAEGRNVYLGAALRLPDTNRTGRSSSADFYVATAVPIDIDHDYDTTRARMAAVCDDGLVVTTGLTPHRRSQHWTRLVEPCDDETDFGHAFAALVMSAGADMKVKDAARIMRLGGTVSYPDARKQAAGYCTELTQVTVRSDARPSDIERLKALEPTAAPVGGVATDRPAGTPNEIERDWVGRVTDGREAHFRDLLLKHLRRYQEENGADPSVEELFEQTFADFSDPRWVDNRDGRWTSDAGRRELMNRAQNTMRRLRGGRLARAGLYSIETETGREEAERVQANRAEARQAAPASIMTVAPTPPEPGATLEDGPFRASSLSGEPAARRWIVPDWIVEGAVNSLYGDGGLGKTLLAQQLACAVAMGAPWLGMQTTKGSVLAVLCEDDQDELHRRHNDIKAAMGHAIGNPFDDVWLWPRVGHENVLVRWDRDGQAQIGPFAERLVQVIERDGPSLVILDTLADFYGGNEIDRVQVNYFVKTILGGLIERRKAVGAPLTILLLGHPSVAGKASGGGGYSGSTAWNNAVRSRMYLTRPEEGASDERVLTRGKANYAKSGDETAVRLFYADGVLRATEDAEDGDSLLWGAMREATSMVDAKWRSGAPYNARKTHDRYIHTALAAALVKSGYRLEIARQAIRECIDDGKIRTSKSDGKSGYRGSSDA